MSELKTGIQEGSEKYQHFSIREQNYKHYTDDQHDEFSLQKTQTSKQYNYKAKQCCRLKVPVLKEVKQGLAWQYQFQCMTCAFITMYMCIKSCPIDSTFNFDQIFIKLAGNRGSHEFSDEFELWQDQTIHFGVTCP